MLGRLLGGVATSLLFSVFDAWMVFEHNKHGFDPAWMSSTFSAAAFGNSMVAICAGMVAQVLQKTRQRPFFFNFTKCRPSPRPSRPASVVHNGRNNSLFAHNVCLRHFC